MLIRLAWPHKDLWPNSRKHRLAVAPERKRARQEAFWIVTAAMGRDWVAPDAVHIGLTFCPPDGRARDLDNMLAAYKSHLDGISDAIGVDDSRWSLSLARGDVVRCGAVMVAITAAHVALDYRQLHERIIPHKGSIE